MRTLINPHVFNGTVTIPASKSHTVRRLLLASLTDGVSRVERPLDSLDTQSCAAACRIMGAELTEERGAAGRLIGWTLRGRKPGGVSGGGETFSAGDASGGAGEIFGGAVRNGVVSGGTIDVGNSGTTLFLAIAAAALGSVPFTFTGDDQIARRSAAPLLDALAGLGVSVTSSRSPDGKPGCTPVIVCGPWKGGRVSLSCPTSQYLSALLIAAPLASAGTVTEIEVPLLNEKPYVEMTLAYLKAQGLYGGVSGDVHNSATHGDDLPVSAAADFSHFVIRGGNAYTPVNGPVPGDFSSAAFPAAASVISKGTVTLLGLDPGDTQGDKVFFEYLERMGCDVRWERENPPGKDSPANSDGRDAGNNGTAGWRVTVSRTGPLRGGVFDLNATPDLLPVMAALGAFAEGETSLVNAAHARIKETDRIAVMAAELRKLFAGTRFRCEEKPDGLLIHGAETAVSAGDFSSAEAAASGAVCTAGANTAGSAAAGIPPARLDGHDDHRVVMALACAALGVAGPAEISSAEAADVTYPGFLKMLEN